MIKRNTRIQTLDGFKLIQDITENDMIMSYDIKTGAICYNRPNYISKEHRFCPVAIINDLYFSDISCILDYDLNEEVLIDCSKVIMHPKLNHLRVVGPDLSCKEVKVVYDNCEDDFYSLSVENTDIYFANNVMVSNGTSLLFVKSPYKFLTENQLYKRVDVTIDDKNIDDLFKSFNLPSYHIEKSAIRYLYQALFDCKKYDTHNYMYKAYYERAKVILAGLYRGEVLLCR